MDYQFTSGNTLDFICLHDCTISQARLKDNNLTLEFESIDVLPEHPLNSFSNAKYTSDAALIFKEFQIVECVLFDTSNIKKRASTRNDTIRISLDIRDLAAGFEVLRFNKIAERDHGFRYEFFGVASSQYRSDFAQFVLDFTMAEVCWTELVADSWFVKSARPSNTL